MLYGHLNRRTERFGSFAWFTVIAIHIAVISFRLCDIKFIYE